MEVLFKDNIVFIFFFAMIAIFNYSSMKEYQRIAIIYITVYGLVITNNIDIAMAILLLCITMICYLEILSEDEMKFKILANPMYKILDCIYLSIFQYNFCMILLAIILCHKRFESMFGYGNVIYKILSALIMIIAISNVLKQKFVIKSFKEMYRVFTWYPINKVKFNDKLSRACDILIAVEDRTYYERKGYTFLSIDAVKCILYKKFGKGKIKNKITYALKSGKRFVENTISGDRGYSTIPMQLVRTLGISRGYNYKYRRKVFEFIYSKMFFDGIRRMLDEDKVAQRENIKQYYLYIYFHTVKTYLGDATFSKFLNAFDMQYGDKNKKDIYDCTYEGIFIACMGLSKRSFLIDRACIKYYRTITKVNFNETMILHMLNEMMNKPYDGNYLM